MILSRINACLIILTTGWPFMTRIKGAKWYRWLLLILPFTFMALIATGVFNVALDFSGIHWELNIVLPMLVIYLAYALYIKFVAKAKVYPNEWFILPMYLIFDVFIKIVFKTFAGNDFNFYNNLYAPDHSQILFTISYFIGLNTTTYLICVRDLEKDIRADKILIIVFGYITGFTLIMIQRAIYLTTPLNNISDTLIALFALTGILLLAIVIFFLYELNKRHDQEKQRQENRFEQIGEYYNKQLLLNQDELIKLRHDLNNFLEVIKLKDEKMFNELSEKVKKYNAVYFCSDDLLNKILVLKVSEGKEDGIDFDIKVSIDKDINMSSSDKISLFTNILDNAIDAAKVSQAKKISLDVNFKDDLLYISLINSCEKIIKKQDAIYHGKGKEIVADIVKKYSGEAQVYFANKMYSLEIEMNFNNQ